MQKIGELYQRMQGSQFVHTFKKEQQIAFTNHINYYLKVNCSKKNDQDLKDIIPIQPDDIFKSVQDGIILWYFLIISKMINLAHQGTILPKAINLRQKDKQMVVFKKDVQIDNQENLNLAISTAKTIGCVCVNIHPHSIREGKQHIILGLVWQIIKIQMLKKIDLKQTPALILLKKNDQELNDLLKLPSEQILMRWVNWHMEKHNSQKKIKNFGSDFQDVEPYMNIFNTMSKVNKEDYDLPPQKRAQLIIQKAKQSQIKTILNEKDILQGNQKLNLLFCAQIFNANPCLQISEQKKKEVQKATMLEDDDPDQSRQIRMFKMWINSLGIEKVYVTNLVQDMRDGIFLLKLIQYLKPGIVKWNQVAQKQTEMRIKRLQNCNYAVELLDKQLKIKIVGIGGLDIVDANKKLLLAIIWQICKMDSLKKIGDMTQQKLIQWANKRVSQQMAIKNLKDKSLKTCFYWFKLVESIQPEVINHEIIIKEESQQMIQNNCKYALSLVRKLGGSVFVVWQHLKDVNSKFLLTFLSSIYNVAIKKKNT